jgi:hypothetical protein
MADLFDLGAVIGDLDDHVLVVPDCGKIDRFAVDFLLELVRSSSA